MRSSTLFGALALLGSPALPALADDVAPLIEGGRLTTHQADDTTGDITPGIVRVFAGEFLPPSGNIESTDEPGNFANAGTFLDNSMYGVDLRSPLKRWTGSGFAPTTSQIIFTIAGQSPLSPPASDGVVVPGFTTSVGANQSQEFDWHFFHNLFGPGAPGAAEAPDGIWLMSFQCHIDQPGQSRLTSDPYWVVYNSGGAAFDADEAAAVQWANDNLAPSPSGAAIAMCALAAAGRRRRPISRSIRSQENRR